jgi:hypothetical protein
MVKREPFTVSLYILGMRNLVTAGLLPVNKAYISLNAKSLVPPKTGRNISNIETKPSVPGINPTLKTTLQLRVPLPLKKRYCPKLQCSVFDSQFSFMGNPVIGNFVIPVGQIMHDGIRSRD